MYFCGSLCEQTTLETQLLFVLGFVPVFCLTVCLAGSKFTLSLFTFARELRSKQDGCITNEVRIRLLTRPTIPTSYLTVKAPMYHPLSLITKYLSNKHR